MDHKTCKDTIEKILVSVPDYMQKVKCDTNQRTHPFKCAVGSCRNIFLNFQNRDKYPYKFHNFPCEEKLNKIWRQQCGLTENVNISKLKVCSDHFSLDDYIRNYKEEFQNPNFKRKLKSDAVPRNNLHNNTNNTYPHTNSSLLSIKEIKEALDENKMLNNKYKDLLKEKSALTKKISLYRKKNDSKLEDLKKLQQSEGKNQVKTKSDVRNRNTAIRKVFSDAQINLLLGKKKVFWSEEDLIKAFTLRHIGNKECYLYLKNKHNIPLPALACVQKWAASDNS